VVVGEEGEGGEDGEGHLRRRALACWKRRSSPTITSAMTSISRSPSHSTISDAIARRYRAP
jgi:hypothetical protein